MMSSVSAKAETARYLEKLFAFCYVKVHTLHSWSEIFVHNYVDLALEDNESFTSQYKN